MFFVPKFLFLSEKFFFTLRPNKGKTGARQDENEDWFEKTWHTDRPIKYRIFHLFFAMNARISLKFR